MCPHCVQNSQPSFLMIARLPHSGHFLPAMTLCARIRGALVVGHAQDAGVGHGVAVLGEDAEHRVAVDHSCARYAMVDGYVALLSDPGVRAMNAPLLSP